MRTYKQIRVIDGQDYDVRIEIVYKYNWNKTVPIDIIGIYMHSCSCMLMNAIFDDNM